MHLNETWFLEGYIDFELQKYRLLAYLKEVHQYFHQSKLYPQLSDLIFHYNNLVSFRENKRLLQDQFPKRFSSIDMQRLELLYENMLEDDEMMKELEEITNFSLEKMRHTIEDGTGIYELVQSHTTIEPIGILPLYKNEGYMLLRDGNATEVRAYAYTITLFGHRDTKYKGLKLHYVDSFTKSITHTYEYIKREIIRQIPSQPNPAVYLVASKLVLPVQETLLPIAKRILVKHVDAG